MATRPESATCDDTAARSEGLGETARRVLADATTLVRSEARLAGLETRDNLEDAGRAAARIAAGGLALGLGLVFLVSLGLVALAQAIGWVPALALAAAVHLVAGALLVAAGLRAARLVRLLPAGVLRRLERDLDRLAQASRAGAREPRADPGEM